MAGAVGPTEIWPKSRSAGDQTGLVTSGGRHDLSNSHSTTSNVSDIPRHSILLLVRLGSLYSNLHTVHLALGWPFERQLQSPCSFFASSRAHRRGSWLRRVQHGLRTFSERFSMGFERPPRLTTATALPILVLSSQLGL